MIRTPHPEIRPSQPPGHQHKRPRRPDPSFPLGTRTARTATIALVAWGAVACTGESATGSNTDEDCSLFSEESADAGSYRLTLEGELGVTNINADNVDTQWSESIGTIWMGNDSTAVASNDEPIATLTMIFNDAGPARVGSEECMWAVDLKSVALSVNEYARYKDDGGNPEGWTFRLASNSRATINDLQIGPDWVSGILAPFVMEEFFLLPTEEEPILIVLSGRFTALSN